ASGCCSQTLAVTGTETFYNLTTNEAYWLDIASGALITTGTFTQTAGQIKTGTIQAQGGVTVGAGATGGDATLQVTSAGNQIIEGNGGTLPNLQVSKPSG